MSSRRPPATRRVPRQGARRVTLEGIGHIGSHAANLLARLPDLGHVTLEDPLISGAPAVCCPICRAWHHQTDERPCWTYSDFCAACPAQRTALDGRLSRTPEDLETGGA
ncbi:MAG: hypothetical protein FJ276_27460 [Planctomycetes bacterium]|nr:hypothetical protein [Planctomycetota bacterium]